MTDESLMPFGKHAGEMMINVPASYLLWLYENNKCSGKVREYITSNLSALKFEAEKNKR